MIKNILLCTDGSLYAAVATEYSLWLAKRLNAHLTALHITDIRKLEWPLLADLSGSIGAQPYQAMLPQLRRLHQDKANVILETVHQMCQDRDVGCTTRQKTGALVDSILEQEKKADMVVLGQRGEHAELSGEMMGSSVERIVRRSIKPCLVTPGKFSPITKVLIAYDGSVSARKTLDEAAQLAAALHLPLTIITVASSDLMTADSILDEAVSRAKQLGPPPQSRRLQGQADTEILKFAESEKMDLIVMGAYGHSRIREFILGSTTSHVIRKSRMPVLLVR